MLAIFADCHRLLSEIAGSRNVQHELWRSRLREESVRVAVIDTYSATSHELPWNTDVKAGRSFTRTQRKSTAAAGYGTRMAQLIVGVDPYCRLYLARVGRSRARVDQELAAEVSLLSNNLDNSLFPTMADSADLGN